nr:unnamed protein product [Digitaria exilis]
MRMNAGGLGVRRSASATQLGAWLGKAEEVEVVERAVSDERLVESAVPGEDVGSGEVDPVLEAKEEVEVAEAGVGVDGDGGEGEAREGGGEVGGGGGLADSALAGCDDDDPRGGARELGGRAAPVVDGSRGDGGAARAREGREARRRGRHRGRGGQCESGEAEVVAAAATMAASCCCCCCNETLPNSWVAQ